MSRSRLPKGINIPRAMKRVLLDAAKFADEQAGSQQSALSVAELSTEAWAAELNKQLILRARRTNGALTQQANCNINNLWNDREDKSELHRYFCFPPTEKELADHFINALKSPTKDIFYAMWKVNAQGLLSIKNTEIQTNIIESLFASHDNGMLAAYLDLCVKNKCHIDALKLMYNKYLSPKRKTLADQEKRAVLAGVLVELDELPSLEQKQSQAQNSPVLSMPRVYPIVQPAPQPVYESFTQQTQKKPKTKMKKSHSMGIFSPKSDEQPCKRSKNEERVNPVFNTPEEYADSILNAPKEYADSILNTPKEYADSVLNTPGGCANSVLITLEAFADTVLNTLEKRGDSVLKTPEEWVDSIFADYVPKNTLGL